MKKKTNTKKSIKVSSKPKQQKFESHYLAIVLISFLLLEGCLVTTTSTIDWQKGLAVLDVSEAVAQTNSDLAIILEPITDVINNVNQFYTLAATQMTQVLDLSEPDPIADISLVTDGVNEFYQQAAVQLTELLDTSSWHSSSGDVAGISIVR